MVALQLRSLTPNSSSRHHWWHRLIESYADLPLGDYTNWLAMNLVLLGIVFSVRQRVLKPLQRIAQALELVRTAYSHETAHLPATSVLNVRLMALDVARFATFAVEYYRKHQEVSAQLVQSHQIIAQFSMQQEAILGSTNREIAGQYQSVLAYANYLEEQIVSNKLDPTLRYDFDDVCESSFNLKLIAGALRMLSTQEPPGSEPVPLATLMKQTMLALAPTLDRRSMKLTTAEVDESVAAQGDATIIAHILWMMLLGMIRYAADESTLRLRCLHSRDGREAIFSIVVSELSPGQLSPDERSDYMLRQLQHLTPHMFAETIRIHANVQLAEMLVARLGGSISTLPLTNYACEICMILPSAEIAKNCN